MIAAIFPRARSALSHRITRNTIWLLLGRIGTYGLMVVFTLLIARRLGEVGLGQYSFIASVVYLANVFTTFGTDMFMIRQIAGDHDLSAIPTVLAIQFAISLPTIGLICLLPADWLHLSPDAALALRLYSLALIPMAFYSLFSAVLRGVERMDAFTALNLATIIIQVLGVWIAVQPQQGIVRLAAILLGVQIASSLLAGVLCFRLVDGFRRTWSLSLNAARNVVRITAPIALLSVVGIFYQRAAIYLLMVLAGPQATGWYSAAARVVEIPKFGHFAVMGALLPTMVQAHTRPEGRAATHQILSRSFISLIAIYALLALIVFALAAPITDLLYGGSFSPTIVALKVLGWTLIPFTITNYLSLRLFAIGHEKAMLLPQLVSLLVLFAISLISIPRWGAAGAAASVLVAESMLALGYGFLWHTFRLRGSDAVSESP